MKKAAKIASAFLLICDEQSLIFFLHCAYLSDDHQYELLLQTRCDLSDMNSVHLLRLLLEWQEIPFQ